MSSIATVKEESPLGAAQGTATILSNLSEKERCFVAAYIENGYSVAGTAETLGWSRSVCQKMIDRAEIRRAVSVAQDDVDSIDFMNEKWVKAQLMRLFPKVMGEEEIPFVDNMGVQCSVKKFYPDIAMRVLEYVQPKKAAAVVIDVNHNCTVDIRGLLEQREAKLQELVGNTYENGETT